MVCVVTFGTELNFRETQALLRGSRRLCCREPPDGSVGARVKVHSRERRRSLKWNDCGLTLSAVKLASDASDSVVFNPYQ